MTVTRVILREAYLALGLVSILLGSMWVATGSFPPMVVVESGSMMHDDDGSVGAIDPGDLVLVMNPDRKSVITFVEAMQEGNENYGHQTHGMPGDVIVYKKNGGTDTPVIHRALLKAVSNDSGGWDVPGTPLVNVTSIDWTLDYQCSYHGGFYNLEIKDWTPPHEGYLTTGDNEDTNGCDIDQRIATGGNPMQGLKDESGNPVTAVKDEWIVGVASSEIPWIGAAKLILSPDPGASQVTDKTWTSLAMVIAMIFIAPMAIEFISGNPSREEE